MKELIVNALGEACPVPLIKTQNALKTLEIGDILILQIDHSCAMKNVPDWCRKVGHNVELVEVGDSEWEVVIEKVVATW
jgi:TusA-related sulfurtransferase